MQSIRILLAFLAITFGLTWGLALMFVLFTDAITAVFGELSMTNPLFILAVYSPGIAAFILILRHKGIRGLRAYLGRLLRWRTSVGWYLFLLAGIPLLMISGAALKGTLGDDPFPFSPWYHMFPALAIALFIGPIEEFGWRGMALPLLQQRFSPFVAGLILGAIWGVWHIPAFLLGGTPQSAWSFAPYFAAVLAISLMMTALFNASRGSLMLAALFHFQVNNPILPDAQPYDTLTFIIAALAIVIVNRKTMFDPKAGITDVVPDT